MTRAIERRIQRLEKMKWTMQEKCILCLHGDAPCACKEEKARLEAEGGNPRFIQVVFVKPGQAHEHALQREGRE